MITIIKTAITVNKFMKTVSCNWLAWCVVQIIGEDGDRFCTPVALSGSKEAIEKAKGLINELLGYKADDATGQCRLAMFFLFRKNR